MNNKAALYGLMFLVVFGYTAYVIAVDGYMSIPYAGISSLGAFSNHARLSGRAFAGSFLDLPRRPTTWQ